jgi:PKD repeat protein
LFQGVITGRAASAAWSFGDGPTITNSGTSPAHYWTNAGDYTISFTAYNNDNPAGVSTNTVVHVMLPDVPQLQPPVLLTNGFQFQFAGQSNVNYTLLYATNLTPPVVWQYLGEIIYNNYDVIQVNDPTTDAAGFYRVLAQ